jgi:hypothetical protein
VSLMATGGGDCEQPAAAISEAKRIAIDAAIV